MMAISVVSSIRASSATSATTPGIAATDNTAAGFADLLFSQLSDAIKAMPTLENTTPADTRKVLNDDAASADPAAQATDPALAFLMAAANLQPAMANQAPVGQAANPSSQKSAVTASTEAPATVPNEPALVREILNRSGKRGADSDLKDARQETSTTSVASPPSSATDEKATVASPVLATVVTNPSPDVAPTHLSDLPKEFAKKAPEHANARTQADMSEAPPASAQGIVPPPVFQNISTPRSGMPPAEEGNASVSLPANIAVEPTTEGKQDQLQTAAPVTPPSALASSEALVKDKPEVSTHLQSSAWGHDFASKVVWLAKSDQQQVQININPPQLGPIQISLQVSGDQASAAFGSANAEVRQAIESSLPQLKDMFAAAGLNLGQADVGTNLAQQNREAPSQSTNGTRLANENAILPGDGSVGNSSRAGAPIQQGRGLVDLFA